MAIELRFFATFREAVGAKEIEQEAAPDPTVGSLLRDLMAEYEELDLFEGDALGPYVTVLVNGRNVIHRDGTETPLEDGDTVSVFPPVEGG